MRSIAVLADVIVSDSALSQAIRTLRRTLGDDPREPRFIRTVSRHGYQFTCPDVFEESDDDAPEPAAHPAAEADSEQTRQKVGASLTTVVPAAARACAGAAVAGAGAGAAGGILMAAAPDNTAPLAILPVLALVGAVAGAVGGLAGSAPSRARGWAPPGSRSAPRRAAAVGLAVQWLTRWTLPSLV